ncbi:MAG: SRPBCC family protein [Flavobacteriia bacterium]|nr:SRPBCC family protein [Flavobacteriia bacterium]
MHQGKITVKVVLNSSLEKVWNAMISPEHITQWSFASEDWHVPKASNDLRVGGKFNTRMEAKDQSFGFDFEGEYTFVELHKRYDYILEDKRKVTVLFEEKDRFVTVTEIFDPENQNPIEMQEQGWQMILENFKKYVETL